MKQIQDVERIFFDYPTTSFQLREISRRTKIALASVKRYVDQLIVEGLVVKKDNTIYQSYIANRDSEVFKRGKIQDTIERLHNSGIINRIELECAPDCIILFGSASKGEDVENSDIDLYIQSTQNSQIKLDFRKYSRINRNISGFFEQRFNNLPCELKNNIINGIILKGYLTAYEPDKNNTEHRTSKKYNKNDLVDRRKNKK
jgi:predicted nucleotidyltransferase